jgi:hypothetical protein
MYNKLFTKILDSSIWLQDDQTIRVWITLLASMDEDGFAAFATPMNLAARARVSLDDATRIVAYLEAPDPFSGNPDFEGRRIERTSGGWLVLNAKAHRDLVTRREAMARHRERQAAYRARKRDGGDITQASHMADGDAKTSRGDASVTVETSQMAKRDGRMLQSEAVSEAYTDTHTPIARGKTARSVRDGFDEFWSAYPKKAARQAAVKAWSRIAASVPTADIMAGLDRARRSEQWLKDGGQFVPHASTWLNGGRWTDDLPVAAGSGPVQAATAQPQRVDPCFGMPVPFTKGGAVWWRWYDWIVHQYSGGKIGDAEFDEVQARWDTFLQGQQP